MGSFGWGGVRKRRTRQHVIEQMSVNYLERSTDFVRCRCGEWNGKREGLATKRVTNRQLRELLGDLGFTSRSSAQPKCVVFEHPESKARLWLPSNKDDEEARAERAWLGSEIRSGGTDPLDGPAGRGMIGWRRLETRPHAPIFARNPL